MGPGRVQEIADALHVNLYVRHLATGYGGAAAMPTGAGEAAGVQGCGRSWGARVSMAVVRV